MISGKQALDQEISQSIPCPSGKTKIFGPTDLPEDLEYLQYSDRSFCNMLTRETVIKENTVNFQLMTMTDAAKKSADISIEANSQDFYKQFGDHFIFCATQQKNVAAWKIQTGLVSDFEPLLNLIRAPFKATSTPNLLVGCNHILDLCLNYKFSCLASLFRTTAIEGKLVEDKDQYSLQDIYSRIKILLMQISSQWTLL